MCPNVRCNLECHYMNVNSPTRVNSPFKLELTAASDNLRLCLCLDTLTTSCLQDWLCSWTEELEMEEDTEMTCCHLSRTHQAVLSGWTKWSCSAINYQQHQTVSPLDEPGFCAPLLVLWLPWQPTSTSLSDQCRISTQPHDLQCQTLSLKPASTSHIWQMTLLHPNHRYSAVCDHQKQQWTLSADLNYGPLPGLWGANYRAPSCPAVSISKLLFIQCRVTLLPETSDIP